MMTNKGVWATMRIANNAEMLEISGMGSVPDDRKKWCDIFKEGYANRKITANQELS